MSKPPVVEITEFPFLGAHCAAPSACPVCRPKHPDECEHGAKLKHDCRKCAVTPERKVQVSEEHLEFVRAVEAMFGMQLHPHRRQHLLTILATREQAVREQRDAVWVEECQRSFEDIRPLEELRAMFSDWENTGLPCAVIHEIWKRDPRVKAAREEAMRKAISAQCPYFCGGIRKDYEPVPVRHPRPPIGDDFWHLQMGGDSLWKCAASPIWRAIEREAQREGE